MITAHIGPRIVENPSWARVTTYAGGSTTRIEFRDGERSHRYASRSGGGQRGHITTFSKASRRRLFRLVGTINRYAYARQPLLITLTYPGVWLQKPADVRSNVRAFLKRLKRRYGLKAVLWRLEYQRRGAPHFHMLVFDPPDSDSVAAWAPDAWASIVGTENPHHRDHGCDVRPSYGWRGVVAYLSKYLAKVDDEARTPPGHVGRFWGVESRNALITSPITFAFAIKQGLQARRWLLRAAGRSRKGSGPLKSATLLVDSRAVERVAEFFRGHSWRWDGHDCPPAGIAAWSYPALGGT